MSSEVKEKVESLEYLVKQIAKEQLRTEKTLNRFMESVESFKDEMRSFKDEMLEFKAEGQKYREEAKQDRRDMNKKWGDLANKMGTLIEDIVFPATAPVIRKYFKEEPYDMYIRRKVRRGDKSAEFDVIAVTEKKVYLVDVKSNPTVRDINDFNRVIEIFREMASEYRDKELVPIFASVYLPESLVNLCTKEGFYAMSYREWDYMDILNFKEVKQ
ncbi:MAG: hypothetical protein GXP33_01955 [Spirochaetes bacterium]|nr:hypothetical protein [Spirochaetota bacterium]